MNTMVSMRGSLPQTCGNLIVDHQKVGLDVKVNVAMDIMAARTIIQVINAIEPEQNNFIV